jgi:phosphoribosyl 1,2-cyclic phosphate phosphodiesterase
MIGCHCGVCSSTDPHDHRTRPSIVVSYAAPDGTPHNILIDTTPELRLQAIREGIDRISAVVFTHGHADHIFGLDDVRRYNTILNAPLPVYASETTLGALKRCFPYAFDAQPRTAGLSKDSEYRPELQPAPIHGPFELFGRTWQPHELPHGRFTVFGFRIGNFAYCTDCNNIPAETREQLRGLDVLIIDGLRLRPHPTHLSFEQAVDIANDLQPRMTYLTHIAHDLKHADIDAWLPPHVRAAYDGLKIQST